MPARVVVLRLPRRARCRDDALPRRPHVCPGDEDLEHVLNAPALADALDSTFRIVEACLDGWTLDRLHQVVRRQFDDEEWVHTRGAVLQRVFAHDIYHIAEINETLGRSGLPQVDLWD